MALTAAALAIFPMVMVVMLVALTAAALAMLMVVMAAVFLNFLHQVFCHGIRLLDDLKKLFSCQLTAGRRHDGGGLIMLPEHLHCLLNLPRIYHIGPAEDDGTCVLDLIVEELTEILHVHLALGRVHHRNRAVQLHVNRGSHIPDRFHHIRQFAHARRLDDNPVRLILGQNLLQGFSEIPHQGTADAPGIHLPDLNASVL